MPPRAYMTAAIFRRPAFLVLLAAATLGSGSASAAEDDASTERLDAAASHPATLPPSRLRLDAHVARRLLAQGLYARAAERFKAIVEAVPDHAGSWYMLSRAQVASGQVAEGRDSAARAVELLEKLPKEQQAAYGPAYFYLNLGLADASAARLDAAEEALAKAAQLEPRDPGIRLELGAVLLRRGKDQEARDALRVVLELDEKGPQPPHAPREAAAQRLLGSALVRLSDLDGAQAAYEAALKLQPDDADAHYGLASVFRAKGDASRQDAELALFEELRKAAEDRTAKRQEADALLRDAVSRLAESDCAAAEPLLRKLLALPIVEASGLHRARALADLAKCRADAGETKEAEALYLQSLEQAPGAFTASFELGTLLARQGRLEEAAGPLVAATAVSPFDHAAHVNLGLAWALLGRLNDAQVELEKATMLQPDDMAIRKLLVDVHVAAGHEARAKALAEVGGVPLGGDEEGPSAADGAPANRSPDAKDVSGAGWRE